MLHAWLKLGQRAATDDAMNRGLDKTTAACPMLHVFWYSLITKLANAVSCPQAMTGKAPGLRALCTQFC